MPNTIKKAKVAYNGRLIDKSGNDHKAFWRMIKSFTWRKKGCISKHFYQRNLDFDKNRIADSINKYFTPSVTQLLESVRTSCGFSASPTPSRHYPDFNFAEVSEAYVRSQLRGLKPSKAIGLDNIPAGLLIDSADIVAKTPDCNH